jgi:hypothetical protein
LAAQITDAVFSGLEERLDVVGHGEREIARIGNRGHQHIRSRFDPIDVQLEIRGRMDGEQGRLRGGGHFELAAKPRRGHADGSLWDRQMLEIPGA